jgi:hypothetical protein
MVHGGFRVWVTKCQLRAASFTRAHLKIGAGNRVLFVADGLLIDVTLGVPWYLLANRKESYRWKCLTLQRSTILCQDVSHRPEKLENYEYLSPELSDTFL